ncbi:MAG: DUF1573 domain-containing protein [Bacteroidales bacterium]|nr:DUF1573 domain-containing protein [Bacteroidales bacterium]
MKRLLTITISVCLSVLMLSCQNGGNKPLSGDLVTNPKSAQNPTGKQPVIHFDKTEFDFGKILQGEVVSYTFHFTNTGNMPLIITNVDKSCGCTASDYPRTPIAPGETGDIKITYDSKGHHGFQSKALVVNANTMPAQTTLRIKAEVKTPDNY